MAIRKAMDKKLNQNPHQTHFTMPNPFRGMAMIIFCRNNRRLGIKST